MSCCHATNLVVYAKLVVVFFFFFVTPGFIGVGGNGRESGKCGRGGEEKKKERKRVMEGGNNAPLV